MSSFTFGPQEPDYIFRDGQMYVKNKVCLNRWGRLIELIEGVDLTYSPVENCATTSDPVIFYSQYGTAANNLLFIRDTGIVRDSVGIIRITDGI